MKNLIVLLLAFSGFSASAQSRSLGDAFNWMIWETRSQLSHLHQPVAPSPQCHRFYEDLFDGGVLTVSMALGYMDVSSGEDYFYLDQNLGEDFVLDSVARASLVQILTQPCIYGVQACGFEVVSGTQLVRTLRRPNGQSLRVVLTLTNASASTSNRQNEGRLYGNQQQMTALSEQNYFGGIAAGTDVSIYMGHARSGGGPDFSPPRLRSNGHPDYNYYRRQQRGITLLLNSLAQSRSRPKVIGLLACKSTGLFVRRVQAQSPNSLIVSADELFDYNDIVPTGFALLDTLMAERCDWQFRQSLKVRPNSSNHIQMTDAP